MNARQTQGNLGAEGAASPIGRRSALVLGAVAAAWGGSTGWAAAGSEISSPIEQFYAALLTAMKAGKNVEFSRRYGIVAPALERGFDLQAILAVSVGPRWASLSVDERAALLDAFRRFTISTYVARFDNYNGQRLEVLSDIGAATDDERVVHTRIVPASGESHMLDYVMRLDGGTWKVVDVLSDGSISQVAVQRSDFRRILTEAGPAGLLASLNRKTAGLTTGNS